MATLTETIWVRDRAELDHTVQSLVTRGGQVQVQGEDSVSLFLKKNINIPVLVVGLLLCLVPGLAYLIWYVTADQNQQITVRIGAPENLGVPPSQHWFDKSGPAAASAGEPAADAADDLTAP